MPDEPFSVRLYRRVLRFYPAGFRENYAEPLERAFRDELNESAGAAALAMLWIRLLADLAISVPSQVAREIAQDARHTLRLWSRRPWHTGFAILALAIGIGANIGVFSVVNALLLRSLPFHDPDRLASLQLFFAPHDSAKQFHDWRGQSAYLADAALFEIREANFGGAGEWRRVYVAQTSWNFFSLLGAQPVLGRGFSPGDDVDAPGWGSPGRNAVAVIGYGLWQNLFAGDRRALGSTIRVDGIPLTIIGVAPPGFDYPHNAALWKPAAYSRGNNGWTTIARLRPGITWEQARVPFAAEADRLWPNRSQAGNLNQRSSMTPLRDELAGSAKNASLVLMASVVLILLIACTNVANLLMARTADRAVELSIRSALGASRARLSQQLLTECVLLALVGSVAGLVVASSITSIAVKLLPPPLATQSYSILDGRVLGFAIAVSLVSGLLFGALAAIYAGRLHTFGTRSSNDTRNLRLAREALVAAQVMLTVVLLTASISVGRAFANLMHIDRGFDRRGVVTVSVSLDGTTHQDDARRRVYFQEALARVRRLPGVRSSSATEFLPLYAIGFIGGRFKLDGRSAATFSMVVPVMADYFRTMGGRILAGREFTEAEVQGNANVAIVDEVFSTEFGSPADVVSREIENGGNRRTIVGVVKAMDYMTDGANSSQIFVPSQSPGGFFSAFVARLSGRPEDHLAMIRDAIRSVDPQVPVFGEKTMDQRMAEALSRPQFYRTALLCFAAFALLLAIIGIYGIVSYAVARRTHEMGVRMALGITPAKLRISLLLQGLMPIVVGAIPGIVAAILSGRLLESLVSGAKSVNLTAYAATVFFIAWVAAMGIWTATRPIARLDIVEVLRAE